MKVCVRLTHVLLINSNERASSSCHGMWCQMQIQILFFVLDVDAKGHRPVLIMDGGHFFNYEWDCFAFL